MPRITLSSVALATCSLICLLTTPAQAGTVWTDWTAFTAGVNGTGSATGTVGGIGLSYSGELEAAVINGTSGIWAPASSFVGGTSTASPSAVNDDLRLNGSFSGTDTITFASPITNPVFAIWSLGSPSVGATFTFNVTPVLEAGGPNSQFGGSSITVSGNVVTGHEGNGVVQFNGTLSSITWTDTFENFYAFTVGMNGPLGPTAPEPASFGLLGLGLAGMIFGYRKRIVR